MLIRVALRISTVAAGLLVRPFEQAEQAGRNQAAARKHASQSQANLFSAHPVTTWGLEPRGKWWLYHLIWCEGEGFGPLCCTGAPCYARLGAISRATVGAQNDPTIIGTHNLKLNTAKGCKTSAGAVIAQSRFAWG